MQEDFYDMQERLALISDSDDVREVQKFHGVDSSGV